MRNYFGVAAFGIVVMASGSAFAQNEKGRDNVDLNVMFKSDQAARDGMDPAKPPTRDEIKQIIAMDKERLSNTISMVRSGKLHTANDYYYAAVIIQHGDAAENYLLAHTLATISASRGKKVAMRLVAATLDRYLQVIGQKQIFATQYTINNGTKSIVEPYNPDIIPEFLRIELGLSPIVTERGPER